MTEPIRVVVVDDEPMVCAHLRTILGSADDIEVVDIATTAPPPSRPSSAATHAWC